MQLASGVQPPLLDPRTTGTAAQGEYEGCREHEHVCWRDAHSESGSFAILAVDFNAEIVAVDHTLHHR